MIESNGMPVLFSPSFARASSMLVTWHTSANVNGFATLMIVNAYSVSPAAKIAPLTSATQRPKRSRGTAASAG
jgi:hypothetical protein